MRTLKYIALLAVAAVGFVACDDDDDYSAGESYDNAGVSFSVENKSNVEIKPTDTQYPILLNRLKSEAAATYKIIVTSNEDNSFEVPESVTFNKGSKTAELLVGINTSVMELDKEKILSISVSEADANPYTLGPVSLTIGITRSTWTTLGKGGFYDEFYGIYSEVEWQYNENNKNIYRITYPYEVEDGANKQDYIEFTFSADRKSVTWNEFWYTGALYDGVGTDIKAYLSSYLSSNLTDESEVFFDDKGNLQYFIVNPYYYIDGLGGWGNFKVYASFPDFDLEKLITPEEEEEEEEGGQDFAYGASIDQYAGNYIIKYYSAYTESYVEEEVTLTIDGNNVVISEFDEGVTLTGVYSKGLLYFGYQEIVIDEDPYFVYPSTSDEIFDEAYLYAGFNNDGVIKIKNYPYNGTYDDDGEEVKYPTLDGFYILNSDGDSYDYISKVSLTPNENKSAANKSLKIVETTLKSDLPTTGKNTVRKAPQTVAKRK